MSSIQAVHCDTTRFHHYTARDLVHSDVHQLGHFGGLADELEGLKRDKNILMVELVRLRQQQQVHDVQWRVVLAIGLPSASCRGPSALSNLDDAESNGLLLLMCLQASDEKYRSMQSRLERQEQRQVQMMQFLSKALQHPEMLQSLVGARQQRFDGSVQGAWHAIRQTAGFGVVQLGAPSVCMLTCFRRAGVQHMCVSCWPWNACAGRKKLKRRAARDDSSESNGGTDPGNQLVQYQGGITGGTGQLDIPDFFNGLMALDDSGDSAELRRDQPNSLMEVGTPAPSASISGPATRVASF